MGGCGGAAEVTEVDAAEELAEGTLGWCSARSVVVKSSLEAQQNAQELPNDVEERLADRQRRE